MYNTGTNTAQQSITLGDVKSNGACDPVMTQIRQLHDGEICEKAFGSRPLHAFNIHSILKLFMLLQGENVCYVLFISEGLPTDHLLDSFHLIAAPQNPDID